MTAAEQEAYIRNRVKKGMGNAKGRGRGGGKHSSTNRAKAKARRDNKAMAQGY